LAFRQSLSCLLDRDLFTQSPDSSQAMVLDSFVVPNEIFWFNANAKTTCSGDSWQMRLSQTTQILKAAGYSWDKDSGIGLPEGFKLPNGQAFPKINLFVPQFDNDDPEHDPTRSNTMYGNAAGQISLSSIQIFGVSSSTLNVQGVSLEDLHYDVFSSHQYDMALLGYNVSEYPGYLCDWFKDGNPFGYHSDRLRSACEALNSTSDLSTAQKDVYEIQSILAQDLPFIPLYSDVIYDAYRNIKYPFGSVLGGLSGIYGAPSLAIPAP